MRVAIGESVDVMVEGISELVVLLSSVLNCKVLAVVVDIAFVWVAVAVGALDPPQPGTL